MSEEFKTVEREFDWDDTIENDGGEYVVLPEGDYQFTVKKFERGRSKGSDKLPASNMAIITLEIRTENGRTATMQDNLVLHTKLEWKLCQFYRAIGLKKHDEPLKMNWPATIGRTGRCKIINDPFEGRDGNMHDRNRIDRYYDPDDVPVAAAPAAPGQKSFW